MSTSPPESPDQAAADRHGPRPGTVAVLMRLLPFARPAMPSIIAGMVVALVGSLLSLVIPQVLRGLVDGPLGDGDSAAVVPAVLLILGLGILEAAMIALRRWFVLKPGTLMEADMRNSFYRKLQRLPVAFHDRWQSGQLLSRMVSDLNLIRRWMAFGLVLFVVNILTILVGIGFLVSIDWRLGLGFLVCSVPLWVYGYLFEQKYSSVARLSQDQSGDLATSVEQSVHGIRVLKAFGRGKHMHDAFAEQAEELRGTEIKKAKAIAGIWLWLLLVPDLTFALALLGGVLLASAGEISVGDLVAFFATAAVLRWPIESVGFLLSMTFDARTAIDRYFEVMDEEDDITDPEAPVRIAEPRGHLVFRGAHFRYQDAAADQADLIDGVDLDLQPGETMALVGVTGSGKSTLTALTTRLYDVTGGSIELDGVDIRDLRLDELRSRIAMAFEDATLFSSSVRDNVLLGRPDLADGGPEADRVLQEALDIAQAGFVRDLPDGIETTVGEEGLSLSGGQRQRLALARAVAAAPDVLVLDDPLSALDVDTEALVEAALRRVLASTTALIVAHRPSTVMLADRVALMQDGRITAVGRHSDLLATSEHYRFVISSLDVEGNTVREEASA
ncbi:ABC transporter ATP-binding protein [Clavibacter nebraskensis]